LKEKANEFLKKVIDNHAYKTDLILTNFEIRKYFPNCTEEELSCLISYLHIDKKNVDIIRYYSFLIKGLKEMIMMA
jgi:hypothetical protein